MHKKIIFAKIFIYLQVPALAERLVRCLLSSLFILPFDEKPGNNSENCSSFLKKSLYIEEYKGNFSPTANLSLCAVCMRGNFFKTPLTPLLYLCGKNVMSAERFAAGL